MKRTISILLGVVAMFVFTLVGTAQAKDLFYYLGYNMVQVIDGENDQIVADIPAYGAHREAESTDDEKFLYVSSSRHLIHKIDLSKNQVVKTVDISSDGWDRNLFGFVLAADGESAYGSIIARTTENGEAIVPQPVYAQIDLETGAIMRSIEVPWGIGASLRVKGGKEFYAIGQDIYKIDVSGEQMKLYETYPLFDKGMNFLPFWWYPKENDGLATAPYYSADGLGFLSVDLPSGKIEEAPVNGVPPFIYCVILSPDGKRGYGVMDELVVFDMEQMKYFAEIPLQEGTSFSINISSDGKKVYTAGGGSTITVIDTESLKPIKVLQMATDGMKLSRVTK